MKKRDLVLLLSKNESYLVDRTKGEFNTKSGIIKLELLSKAKFGGKIKTHLGKEFIILKPSILDLLKHKIKRSAQVILPKDIGLILTYTGISSDSEVVDAGTGTGYLALMLANYISNGKIVTYEKDKRFAKIAKENIKISGFRNVKLKEKNISKGIDERNVDLITLDLQYPERIIKHAYKALRLGGWLVIYSPTIEEVINVVKEIKKMGFSEVKTIENIVREWKVDRSTRPETIGLMHTGWLTFARKVL